MLESYHKCFHAVSMYQQCARGQCTDSKAARCGIAPVDLKREVQERLEDAALVLDADAADLRTCGAAKHSVNPCCRLRRGHWLGLVARDMRLVQDVQQAAQVLVRVLLTADPEPAGARDRLHCMRCVDNAFCIAQQLACQALRIESHVHQLGNRCADALVFVLVKIVIVLNFVSTTEHTDLLAGCAKSAPFLDAAQALRQRPRRERRRGTQRAAHAISRAAARQRLLHMELHVCRDVELAAAPVALVRQRLAAQAQLRKRRRMRDGLQH